MRVEVLLGGSGRYDVIVNDPKVGYDQRVMGGYVPRGAPRERVAEKIERQMRTALAASIETRRASVHGLNGGQLIRPTPAMIEMAKQMADEAA